ncbi:hypothetical protein AKJ18_31145, partial [Vibrio xuii]
TFKAKRNRVAINRTVGKAAKSKGLRVYTVTSNTTIANAILKVKNRSSKNAGIGNTTMANVAKTMIGAPIAGIARCGMGGNLSANGKDNFIDEQQ